MPTVVGQVCVVDVAECVTATNECLPGGDTPARFWLHRLDGGAAGLKGVVLTWCWLVDTPVA